MRPSREIRLPANRGQGQASRFPSRRLSTEPLRKAGEMAGQYTGGPGRKPARDRRILAVDELGHRVGTYSHALPKHGGGAAIRPLVFSGQQPKTCLLGRAKHSPPEVSPWAGLFLRSSGSPRLPQKSGNTRLGRPSPSDRQAGCLGSRPDRVPRLLPGQTRIPPGNCYANGDTITSGKAEAHPRLGRRLEVKTRCPSWSRY